MNRQIALFLIFTLMIVAAGCQSSFEKRIKKDIAGIDEQLYDLEKSQIKSLNQQKELKKKIDLLKNEKKQIKKAKGPNELDNIYKDGYKKYLEQNYSKSIELLSQLTAKFADNSLTDNALYWQAESHFKLNQIDKALKCYQLIYRYFPFSNKADYSLYKIGMIYYNKKNYSRALLAFNRLVADYKSSDLYKAASLKLKQIKKNRRKR
ncbi:MAG: tetratricopeptide repeat protein [bacterium]|nr:tetratricopeptide repeat protein [bacterium]